MPSFEQNAKSKLWSVRFREVTSTGVKNKRLSGYKTKREAVEAFKAYKPAPGIATADTTVDELAEMFFDRQQSRVKESTMICQFGKYNKHIKPVLGDIKVKNLKPSDIDAWQNGIKLKHSTVMSYRKLLVSIIRYGERYHDLPNIIKKVDPPRNLEGK